MEKADAARILFFEGIPQKEIGELLDLSEKTISNWVTDKGWKQKRAEHNLHRETAEENIWNLIDYQLEVINRIVELNKEGIDQTLTKGELQKLLIDRGDIDALQKLFTTIKDKEMDWSRIVKVCRDIMEHIERNNLALAKEVAPLITDWLNEKRQEG